MSLVLIGGGSRSGKSRYALQYAKRYGQPLAFIATAEGRDDEMRSRIAVHQRDRGPEILTIEAPLDLTPAITGCEHRYVAVVIDCLTLWISNMMLADPPRDVHRESREFIRAAQESSAAVVVVTNEVGCGIVPDNPLAREFRDLSGSVNQLVAEAAMEVYWMVFGHPMRVK